MFERRILHEGLKSFRIVRAATKDSLESKIRIQLERWEARYQKMAKLEALEKRLVESTTSDGRGEAILDVLKFELNEELRTITDALRSVVIEGASESPSRRLELWAKQACAQARGKPDFDLLSGTEDEDWFFEAIKDPKYHDAVRIIVEFGKASTATLQRRLQLGYGRAARMLDAMQREGIIGEPDGSNSRQVLRRPDWLSAVGGKHK